MSSRFKMISHPVYSTQTSFLAPLFRRFGSAPPAAAGKVSLRLKVHFITLRLIVGGRFFGVDVSVSGGLEVDVLDLFKSLRSPSVFG